MAYLNIRYHVNSGTITTGTGTTRYRVSGNLVQRSTNSGSTWSTLYSNVNATSTTTYVDLYNVATYGATRTGYRIVGTYAYRAKSTSGNVINQDTTSSSSANAATVARINGSVPSANTTINMYINWIANTYTVTLNRNGGPNNGTASVTATYNSAMPSATMPTRQGYTFQGYWSTSAASGGTQYYYANGASVRAYNIASATTLYARWTKNNYDLTLNLSNFGQYQVLPYDGKIEHWDDKIYDNLKMLAQHGDGYFASGVNDVASYVNNSSSGNGTSTVTRAIRNSDNPFNAGMYELQVAVSKNANTAYIGFVQSTTSAASQVFTHVFVAKLPVGYSFEWASNSTGTGREVKWLTPKAGTGKYEVYAYEHICGSTGTFSTFGHVYVQPNNTAFTFTFYVAYSEIFKTTRSQVFSIPYNTTLTDLPIPKGAGRIFRGWCTSPNGTLSNYTRYGRDMMYTNKISIHVRAYMENWSEYLTGNDANGHVPMRILSCTEGGGWSIYPGTTIIYSCYDPVLGAYNDAISNVTWDSLSTGWHDFDMIFDGSYVRGYLDRELIATSNQYTGGALSYNAGNGIFIAGEPGGTETAPTSNPYQGYVGDVSFRNVSTLVPEDSHYLTMPAMAITRAPYWGGPTSDLEYSDNINLSLHTNGGLSTTTYMVAKYGDQLDMPTPIKNGYTFKGWYYDFNGINYLSFGRLFNWTDKFSIHMDIYKDDWSIAPSNSEIFMSCTESGGYEMYVTPSTGNLVFQIYDSTAAGYVSASSNILGLLPGWHGFDFVFNGTNIKLYIDDELKSTSSDLTGPVTYNAKNSILLAIESGSNNDAYGRSPSTYPSAYNKFKGKIANLKIERVDYKLPRDIYTLQVPAQDADVYALWEPNDSVKVYGTESHLTDLTNTRWHFNNTVDADYTYSFDVNFNVYEDEYERNFILLEIMGGMIYYSDDLDDYYCIYDPNEEWDRIGTEYQTIVITGGTDATNSTLIEWLYDNATLQSAPLQWVTGEFKIAKSINDDLINTTWVIDDNPDIYYFGDIKEWFIDFICDGETYNRFSIDETWEDFGLVYYTGWQEYIDVYDYVAQSWVDNKYKTITIVNGDTTNSELIEWLSQNATCTTDISWLPSSTIVRNLNNTDWILNSRLGFSSILAGHGNRDFYMNFVSNNTNFSRMRFASNQDNVTLQYYLAPNMIDVYTNNPADGHSYWVNENYRLIHITSSEYANTEYWLRENAQMMPKQSQVVKVWNGTGWDIIE